MSWKSLLIATVAASSLIAAPPLARTANAEPFTIAAVVGAGIFLLKNLSKAAPAAPAAATAAKAGMTAAAQAGARTAATSTGQKLAIAATNGATNGAARAATTEAMRHLLTQQSSKLALVRPNVTMNATHAVVKPSAAATVGSGAGTAVQSTFARDFLTQLAIGTGLYVINTSASHASSALGDIAAARAAGLTEYYPRVCKDLENKEYIVPEDERFTHCPDGQTPWRSDRALNPSAPR